MFYIESNNIDAAFNFSVEELFTKELKFDAPVLMLWQADKCVMFGNNQSIEYEADTGFARKEGIQLVRRSSGGGAIYTDLGTILFTVILPYDKITPVQQIANETVAGMIIGALATMGLTAVQEGRNDILLDGKKISGLAQYLTGDHLCTHGSLLYDTDLDILSKVLIANEEKLLPKGIRSIRSRVTNIKPYMDDKCSVDEFRERLKQALLSGKDHSVYILNNKELDFVSGIRRDKYTNPAWTFGGGT